MAKVLTKQAMALYWTLWKSLSYRFYLLSHVPLTFSYHKASFWSWFCFTVSISIADWMTLLVVNKTLFYVHHFVNVCVSTAKLFQSLGSFFKRN